MRHRFVLEMRDDEPDGAGGVAPGWRMVENIWAAVEPGDGRERSLNDRVGQIQIHRVTIRQRDDVEAGMRLRKGARVLGIRAVFDPDERGRRLVLICEEAE